ncbi:MAG: serine/threonine-protein kinase [Myxococcales bacterium]
MALATDARDDAEADQLGHGGSAIQRIGAVIAGSYRLTRHIGSGGSSHVFEAEHLRLGKSFAVKLLRPELDANRRTAQRFRREARAIARLKNEHIVSVVDCGELDDGTPYLVMELLEGEDLRSLLNREGSLPARRAVALIIEACRGLSEVHAAGLVHRDLKPENLFITKRSTGEDWCKVLDFGVAKMESSSSTAEDAIVGTLRYMAPEQLTDSASVGPATDVYALAAILYECLAGRAAVTGSTVQEVMYRIMNAEPQTLSELAAPLPRPLVETLERSLGKSPQARPASTEQMATLLRAAVQGTNAPTAHDTVEEEEQFRLPTASRRPPPSALLVAILVGIVTGATGWYARGASPTSTSGVSLTKAAPSPAPSGYVNASAFGGQGGVELPQKGAWPHVPPTSMPRSPGSNHLTSVATHPVGSPPRRTANPNRFDTTNPYVE